MTTLEDLLSRGYFPLELPPSFNTSHYARVVTDASLSLPDGFKDKHKTAKTIKHNIPSLGLRRRMTGIPNPVTYYLLACNMVSNWGTIQTHLNLTHLSRSKPVWNLHPNGRAIEKQNKISDLDVDKFAVRGLSKYLLITDISRFYGSIYTHSIPWALHTKDVAKKDRTDRLLGNLLDKNARNGQDGQTVGVPIGPDTSLVIAEVILSAFDQMLRKEIKSIIGFRYVDDFEIGFKSYGEAEQALGIIRGLLREFELETNTEKTKIIELPEPVDAIWVGELRRHTIRTFSKSQKFDLTAFFDKAIHFSRIYPTEHVLNYAISVLSNKKIAKENWSLVESFLLQCIMAEGSVLFPALKFLQKADTEGHPIYRPHLQHVMNHIIEKKCTAGHMNEISWALWASLHWSLGISKEAANVLSSITDSVVVLMAIHAHNKGLMPSSFDITKWKPYVDNPDELYGSQWLLAYEANVKGWLSFSKDYVAADPNFGFLKSNGVEFYDSSRIDERLTRIYFGYPLSISQ